MTIIRCRRCHIVVLDSNEDGVREVQCDECGARYRIKIEDGEVAEYTMLSQTRTYEEV